MNELFKKSNIILDGVTTVVNIRNSFFDVYIGRKGHGYSGYFGNPTDYYNYSNYFYSRLENDIDFKIAIHNLAGKVLGCFCKPNKCHGDIICNYLNEEKLCIQNRLLDRPLPWKVL